MLRSFTRVLGTPTASLPNKGAEKPVISFCKMQHHLLLLNVTQAGLEPMIPLPQPTEYSAYRCVGPCLSITFCI